MKRRVIIVTGGTRGIGLGIAEHLARRGCDLVLNGRRPEADVRDVLDHLETHGVAAHYVAADIADADARQAIVDSAVERFGRIDGLVNNAGVAPTERADLLEATE